MRPVTCAPDCDHHEYCADGDPESSREGMGDGDVY